MRRPIWLELSAVTLLVSLVIACGDSSSSEGEDSTSATTTVGTESGDGDGDSGDGDGDGDGDSGDGDGDPNDDCVSDMHWMNGNMGSQFMHPGRDCLDCHQNFHEVPGLVLAGTVFKNAHEVDDCDGVEGVTVTITDSMGTQYQTTSNAAGNFGLFNVAVVPPYTARLDWQGRTREMVANQTVTSCNSCHTVAGAEMAPGRILAP